MPDWIEPSFFFGHRAASRSAKDRSAFLIDAVCAIDTGALLVFTVFGCLGFARVLLTLAFVIYVPGWAITANCELRTRLSRTALPVIVSLVLLTTTATVMVWTHIWQPLALFDIEAGMSIALITLGALRRARATTPVQERPSDTIAPQSPLSESRNATTGRHEVFRRLVVSDALLPLSIVLWIIGVRLIHSSPIPLSIFPAGSVTVYLAALAILVLSIGVLLAGPGFSRHRVLLHLGALIVMLYATAPLVFAEPRFSWLYKHVAITSYIAVYHTLSPSMNIYRFWPGFFTLAAWTDKVAGVGSPLVYASWAEPFFEILYTVELAWALRALPLKERERWLALFLFIGSNWIAQDYFSPQALGLVLSLGVFGMTLHWLSGNPRSWVTTLESWGGCLLNGKRPPLRGKWTLVKVPRWRHIRETLHMGIGTLSHRWRRPRWIATGAVLATFAVLTCVHELSPYIVALEIGALVVCGLTRPWWVVAAMFVIAGAYFAPHFGWVNHYFGITASIGNFFGNLKVPSSSYAHPGPATLLSNDARSLLSIGMWLLALIGIFRRLRQGRPALGLALLAFSPLALLTLLSYGGEGVLRVYLFSLPWTACLAASAISFRPGPFWRPRALLATGTLVLVVALFLIAFFGEDGTSVMTPADVQASEFLYSHTAPGPVMPLGPNFPLPIDAASFQFAAVYPVLGSGLPGATELSPTDVPLITTEIVSFGGGVTRPGYLVVSPAIRAYAEEYGLASATQWNAFLAAMSRAPGWRILYSKGGATIYELVPRS
ncbi:MAG: hypothetical protein ABR925_08465 [Acidimicrobiales bacterium]